jgi:pantoate--beta-alanine ligase
MAQQLNFLVQVHTVATVREITGIALSSRNQHLNEEERKIALRISEALFLAQQSAADGVPPLKCVRKAMDVLESEIFCWEI